MELSPLLLICILEMCGNFLFYDEMIMAAHSYHYVHNDEESKYLIKVYNYSGMFFSFVYFLIADSLRYRSVIIISSIALLLRYLLFFHHATEFLIHVSIILQALSGKWLRATLAYMYSIEDTSKYPKITACVVGSDIICVFCGIMWDSIYYKYGISDAFIPKAPIYVNAIMMCIVLSCCYALPTVDSKRSRDDGGIENLYEVDITGYGNQKPNILDNLRTGIIRQWNNFKEAFTNRNLLKWSIWYSIITYMTPLIQHYYIAILMNQSTTEPFNTKSLTYVISYSISILIILFAFYLFSRKPTNWNTRGDQFLCWGSFALLALTIAQYFYLHQLFQTIIMQIFYIIVEVFCVICLWEIAQIIPRNSYALVIGFDLFVIDVLEVISPSSSNPDFSDTKMIFIHAALLSLLGIGFGVLAKKGSRSRSEQGI